MNRRNIINSHCTLAWSKNKVYATQSMYCSFVWNLLVFFSRLNFAVRFSLVYKFVVWRIVNIILSIQLINKCSIRKTRTKVMQLSHFFLSLNIIWNQNLQATTYKFNGYVYIRSKQLIDGIAFVVAVHWYITFALYDVLIFFAFDCAGVDTISTCDSSSSMSDISDSELFWSFRMPIISLSPAAFNCRSNCRTIEKSARVQIFFLSILTNQALS